MPLPDPAASWAVLIGASRYESLDPLPTVENNLKRLTQLLTDPGLWGLPKTHVLTLHNPSSRDEVLDAVHRAATAATDAILLYFAGHGLPESSTFALHLALPSASQERLHRALPYAEVRREITKTSKARHKVVILDCCYSGRAMDGFMSSSVQVADQAAIEGTYLMTASAETALSLAPPDEDFTAFTGELIRAAEQGVAQGPELLDMGTLYFEMRANLLAKNRPEPQERARNDGRSIALLRNRWGRSRETTVEVERPLVHDRPEVPRGYEALLRRPPREVLDQVARLRENDEEETADRVLAAVAGRRADQEVAATLQALFRMRRTTDAAIMLREAARRPPAEVATLISVLHELAEPNIARALIDQVGAGTAGQIVAVSSLMASSRPQDAKVLLDAAASQRIETRAMIDLIAALWAAQLPDEIDRVLVSATSRMSADEVLNLADALRTTGREETAFRLYTHAASSLAGRPHHQIASIMHAMSAAERSDDARTVVDAAARACTTAAEVTSLAEAMWAVGHDAVAAEVVEAGAASLAEHQIGLLLDALYNGEHDEVVDSFCAAAMKRRSPTIVVDIIDRLHDLGRPVSANRLLASLVQGSPEETVPLLQALSARERTRDVRVALGGLANAPAEHLAHFIVEWAFASPDPEVTAELRTMLGARIAAAPQTSASLVKALATGTTVDELRLAVFNTLFRDLASSLADYPLLSKVPGHLPLAERLLAELKVIADIDTAIDFALTLAAGPDGSPDVKGLLPRPPYNMNDPLSYAAVTYRAAQGQTAWLHANHDIGESLPVRHLVALVAALLPRSPETAAKLLDIVAFNRSVRELPAVIRALDASGLGNEARELIKSFRRLRPEHIRRFVRALNQERLERYATLL